MKNEANKWETHRAASKPYIFARGETNERECEQNFQQRLQKKIKVENYPIEGYEMLDIVLLETVTYLFVDLESDPAHISTPPRFLINGVNVLVITIP